jgi:lipid A disaccharide synthetase
MPKRHMFTRFVRDFQEFTLRSIDYCHYTVPLTAANANGFVFPGEFVGQYGTYEAVAHVYSKTESMRGLLKDDHLLVNKRYFSADVEKAVLRIREQFRAEQRIEQDAYAIFIAPGNEKAEAEFCLENLRKGVKEFLLKYSSPTSLNAKALPLDSGFVTVISVHAGSEGEAYVRQYLAEHGWTGKYIIVTNEDNQHYDAMAASDFGLIQDGQMVSAANALHLPTNAMINMRMHQQWFNDYHNRWWNDMNIICDNHVNKELIGGELWWGKICDTLAENYIRPEARYQMI